MERLPSVVLVDSVVEPEVTAGQVTDLEWLGVEVDADVWGAGVAGAE